MTADCPQPDFVIYLQAPLSRLIQRIEKRGIAEEARMDSHYLQQVIDQYEQFFHNYTSTPLLIVNAADINLVDNTADINALLSQIAGIEGGRHYYNPAATSAWVSRLNPPRFGLVGTFSCIFGLYTVIYDCKTSRSCNFPW